MKMKTVIENLINIIDHLSVEQEDDVNELSPIT